MGGVEQPATGEPVTVGLKVLEHEAGPFQSSSKSRQAVWQGLDIGLLSVTVNIRPRFRLRSAARLQTRKSGYLRQDVGDKDAAGLFSIDDHGDLLGGGHNQPALIPGGRGPGVDLDLAIDQVDDPSASNLDGSLTNGHSERDETRHRRSRPRGSRPPSQRQRAAAHSSTRGFCPSVFRSGSRKTGDLQSRAGRVQRAHGWRPGSRAQ